MKKHESIKSSTQIREIRQSRRTLLLREVSPERSPKLFEYQNSRSLLLQTLNSDSKADFNAGTAVKAPGPTKTQ